MHKLVLFAVFLALAISGCTKSQNSNPNYLHLAEGAKIKGFDPAISEDSTSNGEVLRVYEPAFMYEPFKRPYVLAPLLAESMPTVSKDGMTYTIHFRKGVLFHDDPAFPGGKGREVKAKDFVYSLLRLADPRVQATGFWILEGRIKGLDEWHAKYAKDANAVVNYEEVVEGLKVVDDYTAQIQLKQPYPQLLNALAMPYASVVAREAVEKYGKEFLNHAVGTGAFMLADYNPGVEMTYKKNPNYWGTFPGDGPAEYAGKKLPLVDGIHVRVIVEDQPRWLHFIKGEIDTMGIPKDNFGTAVKVLDPAKPVSVENVELAPDLKAKGIKMMGAVGMDFTYTAFNMESTDFPQFKDKRVRQAIALAIDEREAIQLFFNGRATPAQTPIPPGINGYDPDFKNPYRTGDVEKARNLLSAAGFPGGKGFPEIPYDTVADTQSRQMVEYAQKQLDKIGLKIKMVSNTWPAMLKRIQNRQAQFWGIAWGADYPDAENFLQLFYGPNANPGGMNASYYKNKEFDKLFEKARILPDSPARTEMYKKLAQMVAEDCPVVFGVHRITIGLLQGWIKNDMYDEFPYPRSKYLAIDLEAKKQFAGK